MSPPGIGADWRAVDLALFGRRGVDAAGIGAVSQAVDLVLFGRRGVDAGPGIVAGSRFGAGPFSGGSQ